MAGYTGMLAKSALRFIAVPMLAWLPGKQALAQSDPSICLGWNPDTASFGPVGVRFNARTNVCPANHALLSVHYPSGERLAGEFIPVTGTCCPLPPDALSDEIEWQSTTCRDGFVATGSDKAEGSEAYRLRCTKIDSTRYRLSEDTRGLSVSWVNHFRVYFDRTTSISRLPFGLRLGFGRIAQYGWDKLLCVGYPWGAVLTGRESKYCEGHHFRQLLRQENGQVFPATDYESCLAVDDRYSPSARCSLRRN